MRSSSPGRRRRCARIRSSGRSIWAARTNDGPVKPGARRGSALSTGYGRFDVVHDVALKVGKGEAVALLGPNDAGKTTALKAIMGLI